VDLIKKRKFKMSGHISRMKDERLQKTVMSGIVEGIVDVVDEQREDDPMT